MNIRERLKQYGWLRKLYYKVLMFSPKRIRFRRNLRKVEKFDRKNGTNFGGRMFWDELGIERSRANDYSPSPNDLVKTLENLNITLNDAVCDMGSGKGYAMFQMSEFPFRMIGGVELSEKLCKVADENLKRVMPKEIKWKIYNCDVGLWQDYDDFNIFYIYNSFPKNVVKEVNEKLCESIKRNPRDVIVLYLFPEFPEEFMNDPRWRLEKRGSFFKLRHGMHIFKNI